MSEATLSHEQKRLQELFERCQQEVISQVIGPFGLSAAMFADKNGGNVTTQHNAENGVFANESEQYKRSDYDYAAAKTNKKRESVRDGTLTSQVFVDAYSGKIEPTKRVNKEGYTAMNAELDHFIPVKEMHSQGGWMSDKDGRTELSSENENLHFTTHKTNRTKSDKSPTEALSEENGFDQSRIQPLFDNAKKAVDKKLPSTSDRIKYHSKELLVTGASQAAVMGVRQALGMLLTELVNQLFNEIKDLYKQGVASGKVLLQELKLRAKKIIDALVKKLPGALNQVFEGGLSGFASNLITFLINTFITTAKNVVRIIREGLISLFKAIEMVLFPKKGVDKQENLKAALKLLTTAVLTSLGILFEEALKGFLVAIPVIGVFADIISPVLMGILVGITSALLAYGIDRLFDKYCGPTFDEKMLDQLIANTALHSKFADDLVDQLDVSMMAVENYQYSIQINQDIAEKFASALASNDYTIYLLEHDIASTERQVRNTTDEIKREEGFMADLDDFLMDKARGA